MKWLDSRAAETKDCENKVELKILVRKQPIQDFLILTTEDRWRSGEYDVTEQRSSSHLIGRHPPKAKDLHTFSMERIDPDSGNMKKVVEYIIPKVLCQANNFRKARTVKHELAELWMRCAAD